MKRIPTSQRRMAVRILAIASVLLLLILISPSQAHATNEKCPVLPDSNATADIATTYQGKEVRFCCNECKNEFEENPEIYVSQVPQLQELTARESLSTYFDANSRFITSGLLATTLVVLRLMRMRRPATADVRPKAQKPSSRNCLLRRYRQPSRL